MAYLTYKKIANPIADLVAGYSTKRLNELKDDVESEYRKTIESSVRKKIEEQYEDVKEVDAKIDKTAANEKMDSVTKLVTGHIVQGNDLKLLSYAKLEDVEKESDAGKLKSDLLHASQEVRSTIKNLPEDVHTKLLEAYGEPNDDDPSEKNEEKKQK